MMQPVRANVVKLSTDFGYMEITGDFENNFLFTESCLRD